MLRTKLIVGGAFLCVWIGACSSTDTEFDCATGHVSCTCGPNGECQQGLVCSSHNLCLFPDGSSAGKGGGASGDTSTVTGGTTNGDAGSGASDATGGTGAGNASGGTSGTTGGSGGRKTTGSGASGGATGSGATGGDAGASAASGDGGAPAEGGSAGDTTAGMSGDGGQLGSGGTLGGAGGSVSVGGTGGDVGVGGTGGDVGVGGTGGDVSAGGTGGGVTGGAGGSVSVGGTAGDGAGGSVSVGGTAGDGAGGTAGSGGAGGSSGVGGTAGSGGAGGTSGVGGTSGAGGSSGMSGSGGSAGVGGTAGTGATSGAGGGAGKTGFGGFGGFGFGGSAGKGGGGKGGGGKGGSGGKCTDITIPATMTLRDLSDAPNYADYVYRTSNFGTVATPDYLYAEFYGPGLGFDGDAVGQTFTLGTGTDANYSTCGRCLLVTEDSSSATYFASSGAMTVDPASDQMNGFPLVSLADVTLVEVTIDSNFVSTPVPDGRCLHLTSADIAFPSGWTCNTDLYADGGNNSCDCGCGVRDPDCVNGNVSSCDVCHCTGDAANCSDTSVRTTNNAQCQ